MPFLTHFIDRVNGHIIQFGKSALTRHAVGFGECLDAVNRRLHIDFQVSCRRAISSASRSGADSMR